jgi:dipeptidase E
MSPLVPQIVAFGGGGFSMEWGNRLLDEYVLGLTGVDCPRVCFLPTASGDADHYVVRFYRAFDSLRCRPSHISLFRRETGVGDVRAHLLEQDLVYVGGGSVVSLMGTWLAHGVDGAIRDAWAEGVVMCGLSAGSLCWFEEGVSAFHEGPAKRVRGLGLLPWSNAVHYDKEPVRREEYHRALASGMRPGYAADDGAALHFIGGELADVVTSRPGAGAFHVQSVGGEAIESPLAARFLGRPEVLAA